MSRTKVSWNEGAHPILLHVDLPSIPLKRERGEMTNIKWEPQFFNADVE